MLDRQPSIHPSVHPVGWPKFCRCSSFSFFFLTETSSTHRHYDLFPCPTQSVIIYIISENISSWWKRPEIINTNSPVPISEMKRRWERMGHNFRRPLSSSLIFPVKEHKSNWNLKSEKFKWATRRRGKFMCAPPPLDLAFGGGGISRNLEWIIEKGKLYSIFRVTQETSDVPDAFVVVFGLVGWEMPLVPPGIEVDVDCKASKCSSWDRRRDDCGVVFPTNYACKVKGKRGG